MSTYTTSDHVTYLIDRNNCIVSLNEAWTIFAQENQAAELNVDKVIGHPVNSFIIDSTTKHLYAIMLEKVRNSRKSITVPFRCDGIDVRRFMELEIIPRSNAFVEFIAHLVNTESRTPVALLDRRQSRSNDVIILCSWCKRMEVLGEWLEIEDAIMATGLFEHDLPPEISHSICEACNSIVMAEINQAS